MGEKDDSIRKEVPVIKCEEDQYLKYCKDRFDELKQITSEILKNQNGHEVRITVLEQVKRPGILTALLTAFGLLARK